VPKAEYAIDHEQEDGNEDHPGNPEGHDDGVVHVTPIGGDLGPPPRAPEVKHDSANHDQEQYDSCNHPANTPTYGSVIPEYRRKAARL
jgi:hypothetical protein